MSAPSARNRLHQAGTATSAPTMSRRASLMTKSALLGWSSLLLDGESQVSEHPYGACLSALEVTGAKSLARGELISCAQDCFRRVTAFFPGQLISRRGGETMLREEALRTQSVVIFYRAQDVSTGDAIPGHHVFTPPT